MKANHMDLCRKAMYYVSCTYKEILAVFCTVQKDCLCRPLNKRVFMVPRRGNKVILERSASLWQSSPSGKLSDFELECCKNEGQFPSLQRRKDCYKILLALMAYVISPQSSWKDHAARCVLQCITILVLQAASKEIMFRELELFRKISSAYVLKPFLDSPLMTE